MMPTSLSSIICANLVTSEVYWKGSDKMQTHGLFDNAEFRILALVCAVGALGIPTYELGGMTKGFAGIATFVLLYSLWRYWRGENKVPQPVIVRIGNKVHYGTYSTLLDKGKIRIRVVAEDGTEMDDICDRRTAYMIAEKCLEQIIKSKTL